MHHDRPAVVTVNMDLVTRVVKLAYPVPPHHLLDVRSDRHDHMAVGRIRSLEHQVEGQHERTEGMAEDHDPLFLRLEVPDNPVEYLDAEIHLRQHLSSRHEVRPRHQRGIDRLDLMDIRKQGPLAGFRLICVRELLFANCLTSCPSRRSVEGPPCWKSHTGSEFGSPPSTVTSPVVSTGISVL